MRRYFYGLFFFCLGLFGDCSPIIFVHLGGKLPPYLFTAIEQARYFNPKSPIYLLSDQEEIQLEKKEQLKRARATLVLTDQIKKSDEHLEFLKFHPIDPSISEGFWVYASERFFTLFDFIQERGLENVTHLESDTMVYVEVEDLVIRFKDFGAQMAAPFQSLAGCIPCFVWMQDGASLGSLLHHMLEELKSYRGTKPHLGVNDMQTLASYYRKRGSSSLMPLPTLMSEYRHYYPKRISQFAPDNETHLSFLSLFESLFPDALFDAATFGIYTNGTDFRFCQHGAGAVHVRSLFDPRFFSLFWGEDESGRAIPYLSFKGKTYRLFNLHFHSKKLEEYTSYRLERGPFPKGWSD